MRTSASSPAACRSGRGRDGIDLAAVLRKIQRVHSSTFADFELPLVAAA
jgi:hypothetical protein